MGATNIKAGIPVNAAVGVRYVQELLHFDKELSMQTQIFGIHAAIRAEDIRSRLI